MDENNEVQEYGFAESFNYTYADKFAMEDEYSRHIYINNDIDENIIESAVYHIFRYNALDKDIPAEKRKPIIIYINSLGGDIIDGYSLVDAICVSETPIYTVNIGCCFSMAFLIYIAGHKRYSMAHSEFLLHEGSISMGNSIAKFKDHFDFHFNQVEQGTKEYVLEHSKISEEVFDNNSRREWFFLPEEGKNLGVVDYIVGKDCTLYEII